MTRFSVPDMSCGHCTATIEKKIRAADAGADVACDLGEHTVTVQSGLAPETLRAVIAEAGFTPSLL